MKSLHRLAVTALVAISPSALAAQAAGDVIVRIRVLDTLHAAVAGADVSLLEGLHDVRAHGLSDDRGLVTLSIARGDEQRELVARKIGLLRASVFFRPSRDTVSLVVTMHRQTLQLEAVKVTEREDVKRKSYHADADEIAAATRPILDGMDVLTKLKPDILYGRMPGCGVENIWVNGKLIRGVLSNAMVQARRGIPPASSMKSGSGRPLPAPRLLSANEAVLTVMASIHPEHIEELNYLDCFDTSINHTHGGAALYVVLKEGIAFEVNGRGSYVKDMKDLPFVEPAPSPLPATNDIYRRRLLGVFDELTGLPVADVEVVDEATGTFARTTATGTVSLSFLPEGPSTIEIRRAGYADMKLDVSISPRDTIPLTLLIKPKVSPPS